VLREENEEVATVFMSVRRQYVTRHNGKYDEVVDLNHLAVWAMIDAYGIKNRTQVFERVVRLFHHFLSERDGQG
jgi:hypothetical protein